MTATDAGAAPVDTRRSRRTALTASYLGWMFDGYETYATVLIASTVVAQLISPEAAATQPIWTALLLATTLVSWAIGGLVSGALADRFGRRRVMLVAIVWYAVGAGLTALSPNFAVLLVLRFFTGLGMGSEWGGGASLVSETSTPRRRGLRVAFLQSAFGVGFLLAVGAWQVLNTGTAGDWRWMYALGVLPALLSLYVRSRVTDSALWRSADEARRAAKARVDSGAQVPDSVARLARSSAVQLLGDRESRKRVGLLVLGALASLIGWWAVSTWVSGFAAAVLAPQVTNLPGSITLVVLAYNVAGIIGYLVMGVLADAIGRKPTMAIYFGASVVVTPLFFALGSSLGSLVALAFLNGFFTLGQMTWLALYPAELFPTSIRATATTAVFNIARFPAAVGTLLAGSLIAGFGSIGTAAIVIGCVAYGFGLVITPFLGRETRGENLPGVSAVGARAGDSSGETVVVA